MTIPNAVQHNDDDEVSFTGIEANLQLYREWMNRITTADIEDESIQSQNIVRPRIDRDFRGERRLILPMEFGLGTDAIGPEAVGSMADRLSYNLQLQYTAGEVIRTPFGRSFYLPDDAWVEVNATLQHYVNHVNAATSGPIYTDGAGAGERGGYLSLYYFDRYTNTETELGLTRNDVNPRHSTYTTALGMDSAKFTWQGALNGGRSYDFFIGYARAANSTNIIQLDLTRFAGKIDVYM